ncbi:carbohydrate ABC transporter permease [Paenibacillus thermotolerans]|uniref:carbohydrate ABC transporter permease n=1 Tax=Paenibacillus thermotolerans TaxID=3027807 RepID=UPI002367FD17|nr:MULTISPECIES: sugar ABC transporter permease [unclassified Paenibacillus]
MPTVRRRSAVVYLKAFLFLTPIFISMILFKYIPLFSAFVKSMYEWNGANVNRFVGMSNFSRLFSDPIFYEAMGNIAWYTGSFALIQITLPLLGALLVHHVAKRKLQNAYKFMFLLPLVVPSIIIFLLWRWIYMGNGIINTFLESAGLGSWTQAWLGDSGTALWAIVFVNFPWVGGISFLIFLAGLVAIPRELYEAGYIDGMGVGQRFAYLELPQLVTQIRLVLLLACINQFQSFENVLVLTNGGPGYTTLTPALYLYKRGFEYNELGFASAIGVVLFLTMLLFTLAVNRSFRRRS